MKAVYLQLSEKVWEERVEKLFQMLESCEVCSRKCGVNRLEGEKGVCKSGKELKMSSAMPHFGEERYLVGRNGSGTIFLSNCSLCCVFCQNFEISQLDAGEEKTCEEAADLMLALQERGCHNINWVTPSHFVPQLVKALKMAVDKGLKVPIVYNTGGYDNVETLKLLDGIVDIYMPDMKYGSNENGLKYSKVSHYWDVNKEVVREMYRQVGDLKINEKGIAERGLLIRHLVLPNGLAGSETVLKFIAEEISENSYVNIMRQYRPCWKAKDFPEINRRITGEEYDEVLEMARKLGLHRGF